MTGKAYNKGVRALKLFMEAFSRLRLHSLAPNIKNKADCRPFIDSVTKLREAFTTNEKDVCKVVLNDIENQSSAITEERSELRENGRKKRQLSDFGMNSLTW